MRKFRVEVKAEDKAAACWFVSCKKGRRGWTVPVVPTEIKDQRITPLRKDHGSVCVKLSLFKKHGFERATCCFSIVMEFILKCWCHIIIYDKNIVFG